MLKYKRLPEQKYVDNEAECLYHYVYGANDIFNPHCHDYYEFFLTISGTVTHFVNDTVQKLPEGSLVFIRPDDYHGYIYDCPESKMTSYVNLTFTRKTANLLFEYLDDKDIKNSLLSCDMPPFITLTKAEKNHLLAELGELDLLNWEDKKALKLRLRVILTDILVRYFGNTTKKLDQKVPDWLSALLAEMEQPQNFIAGTDKMVQLSKKSREHLCRSLKKYCHITPSEYINELRLNYASNLLLHTNTPIIEICFLCGFQSVSYFYKVFNEKYGISPTQFKKIHKSV